MAQSNIPYNNDFNLGGGPTENDRNTSDRFELMHFVERSRLNPYSTRWWKVFMAVISVALICIILFISIREGIGRETGPQRTNDGNQVQPEWKGNNSEKIGDAGSVDQMFADLERRIAVIENSSKDKITGDAGSVDQMFADLERRVAVIEKSSNDKITERTVAFTASHIKGSNAHGSSRIVVFDEARYNYGGGYNRQTGIFTAPKPGTYLFSFNILSSANSTAHVWLNVHGQLLAEALTDWDHDSAGNSAVMYLEKGHRAWVQTAKWRSDYFIMSWKSQFMGVLLD